MSISIHMSRQDVEKAQMRISLGPSCVGHGRSCSQKHSMRFHVVNIIWRVHILRLKYEARGMPISSFRTSSYVRFLFECSSESTSGGTCGLYFIPTRFFRYFLSSGIYTGKPAAANIWQCIPDRRGELCVG